MTHTVLVADDSQTIRKIVAMALKASPYHLVEASSARSAMDAIRQRPDIILLDYHMPDGSGYDICRAVKNSDATRGIPVVMLGGTYKNFDENLARQAGADAIVWKPFKTDQLLEALSSALAASGAAARSAGPPPNPFAAGRPSNIPAGSALPQPSAPARPQQPVAPTRPQPSGAPGIPSAQPSQPRTPSPIQQGRPSHGNSSPDIRSAASLSSSQNLTPMPSQPAQPSMQPQPTPQPQSSAPAPAPAAAPGLGREQVVEIVRSEVREAVREELPGLLRNVMGDLFQQRILPRLLKHTEERINQILAETLEDRIQARVRVELESLLDEL